MGAGAELGERLSEQKEVNQSVCHDGGSIPKLLMPVGEFEIEELSIVIEQRNASGFILDSSRFGSNLGSGESSFVEIMRTAWIWDDETELVKGTVGENIDTSNGDLRLK